LQAQDLLSRETSQEALETAPLERAARRQGNPGQALPGSAQVGPV